MAKNFILPFLVNEKQFSIWIKVYIYNLIIINKNLLLSQNSKIEKKNRIITNYNLVIS